VAVLADGHRRSVGGRNRLQIRRQEAGFAAGANGIQLQLLAYLGALRQWKNPREFFGVDKIIPAGAFYVNLRGEFKAAARARRF